MRIKVKLTGTDKIVTMNNRHIVNSFFHRIIGDKNEYHDTVSDYCISDLRGSCKRVSKREISFKDGGYVAMSFHNMEIAEKVMMGLAKNKNFYKDIEVCGIEYVPDENYNYKWNYFRTLTPILLKVKGKMKNVNDVDFVEELNKSTKNKIKSINPDLNVDNFEIRVKKHENHKEKIIFVRDIMNFPTQCHLDIKCDKEVAKLLYNVGIGKSTGSGFGMIYKVENRGIYE